MRAHFQTSAAPGGNRRAVSILRAAAVAVQIALLLALPAAAQPVTVVDADTLKWNGTTWRLHGIDAPEMKQWCGDYPAGVIAAGVLSKMVTDGGVVTCERKDTDRYGRVVGVCRVDGRDLGKALVELGMARAFVRYSSEYLPEEERARAAGLGMHGRDCAAPWDFRAAQRR